MPLTHKRNTLTLVLVLIVVMILSNPLSVRGSSEVVIAAEGITLTVDFGNGTVRDYQNLSGSTVLNVTSSVLEVEVQWYGPLAYIKAIEGLVGEGEYGWEYWVNNEFASLAVNLYSLEDGDTILWKYTSPEPQPQQDPTFIPGVIIVTVSGIGFIAIVYVQTSRRIL
ncbi:MAG: DUF4430 domain-containing protein [Candidatus Thorarchaeota archaeon]|jgi:hypothetical protein